MSSRARRIGHERQALAALAAANPQRLERSGDDEILLRDVPCYGHAGALRLRVEFPEYYPAVPLEAFVDSDVEHPNVHPETGFICLWEGHHAGTAVIEAVLQTIRVVTWHLANWREEHVMQQGLPLRPALHYLPLTIPPEYDRERTAGELPGPRRVRLSHIA
jgi:hypothetical protein